MANAAALIVYAAMALAPTAWWIIAGVVLALMGAVVVFVAPVVLLPLFYRFAPLADSELATRLRALATRAGVPVIGVYQWSLGDRTNAANAALVGLGPTRRVLLSDTLLDQYSPEEIEVIVAHELAHHAHGDLWIGLGTEAAQVILALLVAHLVLGSVGVAFVRLARLDDVAGMPLLVLAVGAWTVVTAPLLLALSRRHERRADRYALELTGQPGAFVSAMRRLAAQNLAEGTPSRVVRWLFSSHPSIDERIATAQRWDAARRTTAA
jgi:STE24 endopeptidase